MRSKILTTASRYLDSKIFKKTQVLRYLIVGGSAFVVEYSVFLILVNALHMSVVAANAISFIAGLSVSFIGQRSWTFVKQDYRHSHTRQLSAYIILALVNLLLGSVIIHELTKLGLKPAIGKIVIMIAIAAWNYFLLKKIIFKAASI